MRPRAPDAYIDLLQQDLQRKVSQLQQCRHQEMQLVENVFSTGTLRDDTEKTLRETYHQIGPQIHQA